ncbi:MAG: electron transfer flavoprotein subunit beta/FixA family protein [Deltaproteobacteria bacterium]|nr:electron transfer flavoprotein subunit beta/FixA family protein [Deltaproteobacteria bacterium]
MHIIVCIKQVPDPEGPPDSFVINEVLNRVEPRGIPPVLSLFDENALEAALRLKESSAEPVKISVLSVGRHISKALILKALAAGADEFFKVEDERFLTDSHDSHATASVIVSSIRNMGEYDLILTGRQSADWNGGQTGIGIASLLGIPVVTLARTVEIVSNTAFVKRVSPDGHELVRVPLPALVMTSNEIGMLRYPTMLERRNAAKKSVTAWDTDDIGFVPVQALTVLKKLGKPQSRERRCRIIEGVSPAAAAKNLVSQLRADLVIS